MSDHAHDSHTGPIKTPAQLLWVSFFSFVAPVFIIIGLVYYVTSADKPTTGVLSQGDATSAELATAQRIARVGTVELDVNGTKLAEQQAAQNAAAVAAGAAPAAPAGPAASVAGGGEGLYKQACQACHVAGVAGAPKFGDKAAWSARLGGGVDALTASVIKGKGAMPAKGGAAAASDADIKAAVEYMVAAVK